MAILMDGLICTVPNGIKGIAQMKSSRPNCEGYGPIANTNQHASWQLPQMAIAANEHVLSCEILAPLKPQSIHLRLPTENQKEPKPPPTKLSNQGLSEKKTIEQI